MWVVSSVNSDVKYESFKSRCNDMVENFEYRQKFPFRVAMVRDFHGSIIVSENITITQFLLLLSSATVTPKVMKTAALF